MKESLNQTDTFILISYPISAKKAWSSEKDKKIKFDTKFQGFINPSKYSFI